MEEQKTKEPVSEEDFIEEYRLYPCLYDTTLKDYRDRNIKLNALKEIANNCGGDVDDVKKRINTIRTRLSRHLKNSRPPSGSGRDEVTIPPEYTHLRWLCKFIKTRGTISNVMTPASSLSASPEPILIDEEKDAEEGGYSGQGESPLEAPALVKPIVTKPGPTRQPQPSITPTPTVPKRSKRKLDELSKVDELLISHLSSPEDEITMFLKSLAPQLRKVSPDNLLNTQMAILHAIKDNIQPMQPMQPMQTATQPPNHKFPISTTDLQQYGSTQQPSTSAVDVKPYQWAPSNSDNAYFQ